MKEALKREGELVTDKAKWFETELLRVREDIRD